MLVGRGTIIVDCTFVQEHATLFSQPTYDGMCGWDLSTDPVFQGAFKSASLVFDHLYSPFGCPIAGALSNVRVFRNSELCGCIREHLSRACKLDLFGVLDINRGKLLEIFVGIVLFPFLVL